MRAGSTARRAAYSRAQQIVRQALVNMRSGNGCVTGCNRDLVKIEDHVARYIKSVDGRLLVFIHLQKTSFSVSCTGRRSPRLDKSYRNAGIDRRPSD
jgi:hypothetical protein